MTAVDLLGGTSSDRAALMLADRRHRETFVGAVRGTVCSHCRDSWPCDARRALDAVNVLIGQAEAWRDHATADCTALGRVWRMIAGWDIAAGLDGTPVVVEAALRIPARRIRDVIGGER